MLQEKTDYNMNNLFEYNCKSLLDKSKLLNNDESVEKSNEDLELNEKVIEENITPADELKNNTTLKCKALKGN